MNSHNDRSTETQLDIDIPIPDMLINSFDLMAEPLVIVNKSSRIIYANLPVARLAGFRTADSLNGRHYQEVQSTLFEDETITDQWKNQDQEIVRNPQKELKMLEIHPKAVMSPYTVHKFPLQNSNRECMGVIHHIKYFEIFRPNDFITGKRPGSLLLNKPDNTFTEKECEIIFLRLQGMTTRRIGDILCLSHRTVENNIQRMYNKAGVNHFEEFFEFCEMRNLHRYLPRRFLEQKRINFY